MSNVFSDTRKEIIWELGGFIFYPNNEPWYDLGLAFYVNGLFFFDHLELKVSVTDKDCGIIIKSQITNGRYVPLNVYTFCLVESLEKELCITISIKPTTSRYYFLGEI